MSRKKGKRNEKKAVSIYEDVGFEVETPNYSRYENTDFFNLFDFMAIKDDRIVFGQVKSNATSGIGEFAELASELMPEYVELHFLVHYDREGFKLIEVDEDGDYGVLIDERETDNNIGDDLRLWLESPIQWYRENESDT